ncbi:hypothetical protein ACEPPN_003064 [Leptodophora sp. 'Broadleaf-Isolate-01']
MTSLLSIGHHGQTESSKSCGNTGSSKSRSQIAQTSVKTGTSIEYAEQEDLKMTETTISANIVPSKSWNNPNKHYATCLASPWYESILELQDTIFHGTVDFFHRTLGYKYALLPSTTDSISSPMGLGSDSLLAAISLEGFDTYLADSMQFGLEYFLRIQKSAPGAYYVGTTFRGEDPDSMHPGWSITSLILDKHADIVQAIAGNVSHITDFIAILEKNDNSLPRITVSQALELSEISSDPEAWRFVLDDDHTKGRLLTRIGERALLKRFGAVWLTEMDHLSVPFYQAFSPGTKNTKALCADLLIGPGEILGLGQRHLDAHGLNIALNMHQVPLDAYRWYSDIRDRNQGGIIMQTTGWGMGLERFLCWILSHDDVRDIAVMPRLKHVKFSP